MIGPPVVPGAVTGRRRTIRGGLATLLRGPTMHDRPGQWVRRAAAAAAAQAVVFSTVVYVLLLINGYRVPFPQLWVGFAAALLIPWIVRTLPAAATEPPVGPDPDPPGPPERPFAVADRWQQRLSVTSGDPEWFTRVVRDRIVAVVAERLRQRHGVRSDRDPARARELLPEDLYEFLTGPLPRTPTPEELGRLVTRIERL